MLPRQSRVESLYIWRRKNYKTIIILTLWNFYSNKSSEADDQSDCLQTIQYIYNVTFPTLRTQHILIYINNTI